MKKNEVVHFMERIKIHYPTFTINDLAIDEWNRKIGAYSYDDCVKKLDEHLEGDNQEKIPMPYWITKYLKTEEEQAKGIVIHPVVCPLCNKTIEQSEYGEHYVRENRIEGMVRDLKKYCDKEIKKEDLEKLNEVDFERSYQKYLNLMIDSPKLDNFRKKIILKIKYPDMELDLNEIVREI